MELKKIDAKTLDDFLKNSEYAHFLQSSAWADVSKSRNYIPHLLGLYDKDILVATALLIERKILYYSTFYCPRGFIIDYTNKDLIKEMSDKLKEYVKKNKGLYLKIDPALIIHILDNKAEIKETFDYNLSLIDYLESLGYKHRGFTTRFSEASMPRFTFRVSIKEDIEEIKSRMHATTRQILNANNPYNIKIRKNNFEDFIAFYKTMEDTAKRKHIYLEPLSFYETFYKNLKDKAMADLFVASIDTKEVLEIYQKEIDDNKLKIVDLLANPNRKTANKVNELENHIRKMEKNLDELKAVDEEELILSAIITAKFKDKVWLVHGGNRDILKFLNANYYLYYEIMMDAKKEGYEISDFYGTEGKIDKNSDLYGLYLFKSRFGGDFIEFIGEFDLIVRPLMNSIINRLLTIRRKVLLNRAIKKSS